MQTIVDRLLSRKFWSFVLAVGALIGSLMVGDLTVPDFVKGILVAAGTYQATEALVDAAARLGHGE